MGLASIYARMATLANTKGNLNLLLMKSSAARMANTQNSSSAITKWKDALNNSSGNINFKA